MSETTRDIGDISFYVILFVAWAFCFCLAVDLDGRTKEQSKKLEQIELRLDAIEQGVKTDE